MVSFRRRRPAQPEPEQQRSVLPGGLAAPPMSAFLGSTGGVPVTMQTALRSAAVWACQRVLVSTVGMLPVDVIQAQGAARVAVDSPPIVLSPSGVVSRRAWVAQALRSFLGAGNVYGRVVAHDGLMRPTQIETISPGAVTWVVEDGAEVAFVSGRRQTLWPLGDFWHVPASQFLMPGTRVAMSPVEYAQTSIGTSLASEKFGADIFERGVFPSSIYYVDKPSLSADEAAAIKASVKATQLNGEPGVLSSLIKREEIQSDPGDAKFIDLLRFEVEQACRFWGVPPSMVYAAVSGQSVTYANVSQADLQFLKYSVEGWIIDLEDAWSELIASGLSVKFNTDAVLRMDALLRAQVHTARLATKTRTVNEVRALENDPPFEGAEYDLPGVPGGMVGTTVAGLIGGSDD